MKRQTTHIFLGGGGSAKDSRHLDTQFVARLDLSKPLVYLPNAKDSQSYRSCLTWFRSVMTPLGVLRIEMWDGLHPRCPVTGIAGIYIGGGDPAKLLTEFRATDFDKFLRETARNGIPIYGGSAGAIILGEDIRTAPEARRLPPAKTKGLKVIRGYSIVCHYKPEHEGTTRKLAEMLRQRIIAIPEAAGGYVTRKTLTNFGTEPIIVIEDGVEIVGPNHSIELRTS